MEVHSMACYHNIIVTDQKVQNQEQDRPGALAVVAWLLEKDEVPIVVVVAVLLE